MSTATFEFDARRSLLAVSAEAISKGDAAAAADALDRLYGMLEIPRDLTFQLFAAALARRIDHRPPTDNLYVRELPLQQISLFNLLAEYLPLVRVAAQIANEILAGIIAGRDDIVLVDLGIGTAQQESALIRMLAERDTLPGRLTVAGIEPGRSSIEEARRILDDLGRQHSLDCKFVGLQTVAESLGDEEWDKIGSLGSDFVVNAAFAAHHIQTTGNGPTAARLDVLRRLRELSPRGPACA
jgi:GRAS domain family